MVNYFKDMDFQKRSDLINLLGTSLAKGAYLVNKYYHPKFDNEKYMMKIAPLIFRAIRNDKISREKLEDKADLFKKYLLYKTKKKSSQEIDEVKKEVLDKITKYNHALIITSFE